MNKCATVRRQICGTDRWSCVGTSKNEQFFDLDMSTASVARGRSLRRALDSDVVVVWSCLTRTACQAIARRLDLEGCVFRIDQICQRIVCAIYREELEVDIAPRQHIDAQGGRYGHVRNFEQSPEARNDLVRILKDGSACGVALLDSARSCCSRNAFCEQRQRFVVQ